MTLLLRGLASRLRAPSNTSWNTFRETVCIQNNTRMPNATHVRRNTNQSIKYLDSNQISFTHGLMPSRQGHVAILAPVSAPKTTHFIWYKSLTRCSSVAGMV